jgi:predicted nucleic acid-binding protein
VVVVDASVALKWAVTEDGSDEAMELLAGVIDEEVWLVAPEHLLGEVGNGLRKRVAQGVLPADDAVAAFRAMATVGLELLGGPQRWLRSLDAALDWGVTTYDALYILLALDLECELVTADLRLVASARAGSLPVRALIS